MKKQKNNPQNHNSLNIPPTLPQTVGQYLENEIIEGRLEAGTKLSPEQLGRGFGISKIPVREALIALKEDGLVILKPRMGFFVADFSFEDVEEIYAVRSALFSLAYKLIVQRDYEKDFLKTVKNFLHKMEDLVKAGDTQGYFNAVNQLHDFYLSHCPYGLVREMVNQLGKKVLRMRFLSLSKVDFIKRSLSLHKKLFISFKKKDVEAVAKNAEEIFQSALKDCLQEIFIT